MHAFIYRYGSHGVVRARLENGRAASFPVSPTPWLAAVSWAVAAGATSFEYRV